MLKLYTSSNVPITLEINDKKYVAEKLTIGDYHVIASELAENEKEAIKEGYKKKKKGGELSSECINECSKIQPASPYDLISFLLDTHQGYAFVLYTALQKRHPEVTYQWVAGLTITDELVQFIYDLLDLRRVMVDEKSTKDNVKKKDT